MRFPRALDRLAERLLAGQPDAGIPFQRAGQRAVVIRRNEVDLDVVVDELLDGEPTWLHAQAVADLLPATEYNSSAQVASTAIRRWW